MVRDVPEAPVPPQPVRRRAKRFIDRESECRSLDQLLASVQAGESRALVLYGEAGVGKPSCWSSYQGAHLTMAAG
jgi:hypothetical protein